MWWALRGLQGQPHPFLSPPGDAGTASSSQHPQIQLWVTLGLAAIPCAAPPVSQFPPPAGCPQADGTQGPCWPQCRDPIPVRILLPQRWVRAQGWFLAQLRQILPSADGLELCKGGEVASSPCWQPLEHKPELLSTGPHPGRAQGDGNRGARMGRDHGPLPPGPPWKMPRQAEFPRNSSASGQETRSGDRALQFPKA